MPWEKQFDKNEAMQKAMQAFWKGGYEATSLCDLLEQMGIQKGSFYATFNSKHELFIDCLKWYLDYRASMFVELLKSPTPRATLENHLNSVANETQSCSQSTGCFLVNAAMELAPSDEQVRELSQKALDGHREIYRGLLKSAKAKGEIAESLDIESTSAALVSLVMGMQIFGRASMPKENIEAVRDQAIRLLGQV